MFFRKKQHPFNKSEIALIETHLKKAELTSSCELRIFIERDCVFNDALERAKEVFKELQMQATQERNALLIYVATDAKKFAIFGDEAIYEKAGGASFWEAYRHLGRHSQAAHRCRCRRFLRHHFGILGL